jgi:two-component system, chemotaxis family, chemotaxis protein CheY
MARTILTVDDSKSVRQMVGYTLREQGFDVLEAADGKEALDLLETQQVDMVITDLNMPIVDGIAMIKGARSLPACKFIPIVMLTTESQDTKKQEGKAAGATGWIVKPFQPAQLTSVVKRLLG